MTSQRFDEYHKHGCHFYGKLVVVEYAEDMQKDPNWGKFNANLTFDYLARAQKLVKEKYGDTQTLLSIPALVVKLA
jgi:hypothetical protein